MVLGIASHRRHCASVRAQSAEIPSSSFEGLYPRRVVLALSLIMKRTGRTRPGGHEC